MDTKQYLNQIERLDKQIQNKLAEIYQLKTMACSVTMANESDRVQKTSEKDKIGLFVARIVQAETECDEMSERRAYIVRQIESIEGTEMYDVLAKKYILKKTEQDIADEMDRTERHVRRILAEAHEKFEEKYGSEYLGE